MQPLIGVFTIPIGDILFKKQRERQEEITGLDHIITEIDKIMQEQGVVTYNIQESGFEALEDQSFRSTVSLQKIQIKGIEFKKEEKKELKEQLFAPLLMNLDSDEQNDEYGFDNNKPSLRKSSIVKPATPKKDSFKITLGKSGQNDDNQSSNSRTPRRTPRELATASPSPQKGKKGNSILSSPLTFFNKLTGVNKAEKMKEIREEEEKIKRET